MRRFITIIAIFIFLAGKTSGQISSWHDSIEPRISIGINFSPALMGTLYCYSSYKLKPAFAFTSAVGVTNYNYRDSIKNSTRNVIQGIFIKPGIDFILNNNDKESWRIGLNLYYAYTVHISNVNIPTGYGIHYEKVRLPSNIFGLGWNVVKVIRFHSKVYMDCGFGAQALSIKDGLVSDSYAPGAGITIPVSNNGLIPTISINIFLGLRYRL